ncbi:MAG: mechanosensitive ion channel family protein [Burkholderiales bacterium]|nr:mechanosensitive ion channel family protein [Burkholderiales bacterium]
MDSLTLGPWGQFALLAVAIVAGALIAQRLLRPVVLRLAAFSPILLAMAQRCDRPTQLLLPVVALQLALQGLPANLPGLVELEHLNGILTIAAVTWLATAAIRGVANGVLLLHPSEVVDNLAARRVQTQTRVLSRIASGTVLIAGLAFALMTFPRARQIGASLLASAGVAGLIAGIAARSVFSNLLAGLQIALAQPIRIDDVLIVEGEWGRVEEITATYVVLKVWDERRLIVPLGWFIDHPFQNWTRRSAEILGTVFLWVDYTLPVDALRHEAQRLCEASPNWDRRVCAVQVTDASDRAMQVRILVSSAASGPNFDLRCELREGLIAFVQREFPLALPQLRGRVEQTAHGTVPNGSLTTRPLDA